MHIRCILMHMRTTLNIDDELLREAQELTGIREKTATVRAALEALIARDDKTGKAYLKLPLPDKESVKGLLSAFGEFITSAMP